MRSNGTRATEWTGAEYHARKARGEALWGKSAVAATKGRKKAGSASESAEMDFGDDD